MTKATALKIAREHGIETRDAGAWILVADTYTHDGQVFQDWIECPRTLGHLMAWLGY